jgi:hypothetical protein
MAIPGLDTRKQMGKYSLQPVRHTKSDEKRKDAVRDPTKIYIGTYSLCILVLKSMRADNPSSVLNKVIKLLGQMKQINDRERYIEKTIVKNNLLTSQLTGKMLRESVVLLS